MLLHLNKYVGKRHNLAFRKSLSCWILIWQLIARNAVIYTEYWEQWDWYVLERSVIPPLVDFDFFVWSFLSPIENFFTHLKVKGCKFWPMLGTNGHWAVRVLLRATVTGDIRCSSPRTRGTQTCRRAFGSRTVTTCFNDLGLSGLEFQHPLFRLRGERSIPLRHRRGPLVEIVKIHTCKLVLP